MDTFVKWSNLNLRDKDWNGETPRVLIATCMKDEGPFILEWIAWHRSIGIENFIVFTNDCTDGTGDLLDRLHAMGLVFHLPNPAVTSHQPLQGAALAYLPHMKFFRESDLYISMDVDEFLNIKMGTGKISDLLAKTGEFDALSVSELNHGTNKRKEFEPGFVTDLFKKHQTTDPADHLAPRGVKTLVRLGSKLKTPRNHRPDFYTDRGDVRWLNGTLDTFSDFHQDPSKNGIDCRGMYDNVVLEHYPLRSLNSFLVKVFRGKVSRRDVPGFARRYWRIRNDQSEFTSKLDRQQTAFRAEYDRLMQDKHLAAIHKASCKAHQDRIDKIKDDPHFIEIQDWIFSGHW